MRLIFKVRLFEPNDNVPYLCGLNNTDIQVEVILHQKVKRSNIKSIPQAHLNYSSFPIWLESTSQSYTSILTNDGPINTIYNVEVDAPLAVSISVRPEKKETQKWIRVFVLRALW